MHAFLIKPVGLRTGWKDTGVRTGLAPEKQLSELRAKHPGQLVIVVPEPDVERMTRPADA